ncbi:transcriptional regulator [Geothermobacter hydrogeniphilus]|uniref:Transcriptional regulator n=1 Tax=Geothermobacter hydrogeniphilus TaxID=1969733 RepID=A0A2K2H7Y3_9BACT|nr:type IV toxin-antitoxin system AbiEi family antitoxin domain-containing protein [Geothermobacter hydrogeniphilus]PNU19340.1 transcriptional regulator [Geothermobacter hydrogeniphilus]
MDRKQQILDLARAKGLIRAADVKAAGISRNYLYQMHKEGLLQKKAVGLYSLPGVPVTEHSALTEVAKRLPHAVVCLVSALNYHGITTQIPHEIWLSVPRGSWRPDVAYPPLNLTYVSGEAYSFGIQEHVINGVAVKIYTPAKTVADCFKFRNKVGLDVAIEALREVWRSRKATMDELFEAAGIDRVSKIMRPYLEATV